MIIIPTVNTATTVPIEITSVEELQNMSTNLSAHYVLANDINASATVTWNNNTGFLPIGNVTNPFNGTFDGNGYNITGLFINRPTANYTGLFGVIGNGGMVKDVNMCDGDFTGYHYVGGIAGLNNGTVNNTFAECTVSGNLYVGGLVGYNKGDIYYSNMELSPYSDEEVRQPLDMGILIDTTGSMSELASDNKTRMEHAIEATQNMIDLFNEDDRVALFELDHYNKDAGTFLYEDFRYMTETNKTQFKNAVGNFTANGGTPLWDASGWTMNYTLENPRPTGTPGEDYVQVVMLFTDGDDEHYSYELESGSNVYAPGCDRGIGALDHTWGVAGGHRWGDGIYNYSDQNGTEEDVLRYGYGGVNSTEWISLYFRGTGERTTERKALVGAPILTYVVGLATTPQSSESEEYGYMSSDDPDFPFTSEYQLIQVAESTGGEYYYTSDAGELTDAFAEVFNQTMYKEQDITGIEYVGGIAGYNEGTIETSHTSGNFNGDNYVGGLAGYNTGTIKNTFTIGNVTRKSGSTDSNIGGFVGFNNGTIINSYTTCKVSYQGVANPTDRGFAGNVSNYSSMSHNYFNNETSGQTESPCNTSAKSTVDMTNYTNEYPNAYNKTSWNFTWIWSYGGTTDQEDNEGYPSLQSFTLITADNDDEDDDSDDDETDETGEFKIIDEVCMMNGLFVLLWLLILYIVLKIIKESFKRMDEETTNKGGRYN